jgi:hypothetical protein
VERAHGPAFRPPADPETDRLVRRPVFIISPVRSGSTLLRLLLNAHSRLHAPHELHVRRLEVACGTGLAERAMGELGLERPDLEHLLWDRVMHRELLRSGKPVIVEKTPSNAFVHERLAACWPDARFVFLLRHPASIARSWHEGDPEKRTAEEAALDALRYMRATERARRALPGHTVRYEELTEDPEAVLRGLCAFLGEEFEPGMLDYGPGAGRLQKGLGDWTEKIRTGHVQPGRALPAPEEVPEPLRAMCAAWGYLPRTEGGSASPAGAAHAEVERIWPRDGVLRVTGRPVGALPAEAAGVPDGAWEASFTLRGREAEAEMRCPAPLHGGAFDVSVPVADLAPAGLPLPARWDLHLVAGTVRLRLGRHLDGVRDKKAVMVYPGQSAPSGALVTPYYTVKDNLSVEVVPGGGAAGRGVAA